VERTNTWGFFFLIDSKLALVFTEILLSEGNQAQFFTAIMNTHNSAFFCFWHGSTLLTLELLDCAYYGGDKYSSSMGMAP